jgi:molybdenum cofactor cytidylyltransferase
MISVILLAAGKSKRMGRPKQLLPFRGSTVLEQIIKNLSESKLDELIVVTGYQGERIAQRITDKQIKIAVNREFQRGIGSSIKCGLTQVSERSNAIMIVLGDQPLIEKHTINPLIQTFSMTEQGILVPIYRGIRGHPVIFDMKYRDELLRLPDDVGGRKLIKERSNDVFKVEVDSESVVIDVDTRGDWLSL